MRSRWIIRALAALFFAWPLTGQAQETAFGDWAKQCEPIQGGGERCYLVQTVKANDVPVLVVVVAYSQNRDKVGAMFDLPLGVHLPSGLELKTGEEAKKFPFEQCLPSGCRALVNLTDEMVESLKNGVDVAVAGRLRNGEAFQAPVSAAGFNEAFGAL